MLRRNGAKRKGGVSAERGKEVAGLCSGERNRRAVVLVAHSLFLSLTLCSCS